MCRCDEYQSCAECHTLNLPDGWLAEELAASESSDEWTTNAIAQQERLTKSTD